MTSLTTDKDCLEYQCESWKNGLKQQGLYYEGVVVDLDSLLESHKRATVTTWGTRRSSSNTKGDLSDSVNPVSLVLPLIHVEILHLCLSNHYSSVY